jgi:hypothetical protein
MKLLSSLFLFAFCSSLFAETKPNIVFILADDLGQMDIGAFNPKTFYETPNIDGLAKRGMKFTQGYAACCVCSPTRGSIMTGKYPPRVGITNFIGGTRAGKMLPAPNTRQLALEEVTIAESLRDAGYATFFAGKWHLGDAGFMPKDQGFTHDEGSDTGPKRAKAKRPDDLKNTDRITDAAVKFIEANKDKPSTLTCLITHRMCPSALGPSWLRSGRKKRSRLRQTLGGKSERIRCASCKTIPSMRRCWSSSITR